ncbi:hypothetical protein EON65_34715 [archaeon]|nr:MAG: hypothetical protein EON65_34715 [archaeon]
MSIFWTFVCGTLVALVLSPIVKPIELIITYITEKNLQIIGRFARYWHGYEVHADKQVLEMLSKPNTLLVGYHSRPTIDLVYLYCTIPCHIIVTYLAFLIPVVSHYLPTFRLWPSKLTKPRTKPTPQDKNNSGSEETKEPPKSPKLIADEASPFSSSSAYFTSILTSIHHPLLLLPGGEAECHKLYHERYQLKWKSVPGFARIISQEKALQEKTAVVVFYTKHCEDIFHTTPSWYDYSARKVTGYMNDFQRTGNIFVFPFILIWLLLSMGLFTCPRTIKLDTYLSAPIHWRPNESPEEFSTRVKDTLEDLIKTTNSLPDRPYTPPSPLVSYPVAFIASVLVLVGNTIGIGLFACIVGPLAHIWQSVSAKRKKAA